MTMRLALPLALALATFTTLAQADDNTKPLPPRDVSFSFDGPFGTFDRAAQQRGFQVYKEVCSACHSLNRVSFASLAEDGGPGFTEAQAKAIAAGYKIPAGPNDKGETTDASGNPLTRPGIIADHFPAPFANEQAARTANGGALPPDLSIVVKARAGGASYVYSILTGFGQKPPPGFVVQKDKYYNPYFEGRNISMPPPLTDGSVTFSDGTKSTVDEEARDVVTFLSWTADPKLEERKQIGFGAMLFLLLLSGLLYLSYRKVWADAH